VDYSTVDVKEGWCNLCVIIQSRTLPQVSSV